ncbi:MAG: LD-carboxypeptidase [Melioribacteraceae bacterium]|nr:LD-carboxypeptidase [Melioribacteraceae bacterium]
MKRKTFLKTAGSVLALSTIPTNIFSETLPNKIKPKRLKKGDTIGLVSPGSFITEDSLEEAIESLELLGYKVKYTNRILNKYGYLGGKDKDRADDINEMFERKDIDAVVCVRGGYGCARMLDYVDYDLIKNNPKIIVGYSDITALLYAITAKTGLVTFHGPVGISTFNEFSVSYFNEVLINANSNLELLSVVEEGKEDNNEYQIIKITEGTAEGELVGGNLSIIVTMIGTEYDIDSKGKLVFLEEIGEEPYRVDRMLTHMIQAGKFKDAAGIVLGVFRNCDPDKDDPEFEDSLSLIQVLEDRLGSLGIPVIYGLSFGHISNKFTLPFGIKARLNVSQEKLTLIESAVV